jgi:PAS domain S-box-containing protein
MAAEKDNRDTLIEELQRRITELESSIVECRTALSSLGRGEELYRLLAENSIDVIFTITLDGRFTYVSPSVTALAGFTPEEVLDAPLDRHLLPGHARSAAEAIAKDLKSAAEGKPASIRTLELQLYTKDGSVVDIEVTAAWILNEKGEPAGIQGSARDIRKKKKALLDLKDSEERYRSLFDRSQDMVYIHDLKGNFIDANAAVQKLLGYTKTELLRYDFKYLLTDDQLPLLSEVFKEIYETGTQKQQAVFELKTKDDRYIFVEIMGSLIYRDQKPYAVQGIGRDITERKRMEDELRFHQEKLELMVQERTAELKEINKKLIQEIIVRKQVENELRISENSIRSRNEVMMMELESARLIQKALMPRAVPSYHPLEIDYRYLPLEAVGGDYFSFTVLDEGGLGIFIGDVTGHGVPAALFLSLVRSVTNQACRRHGMCPAKYIEMINNEVYRGMPSYYLTALYGVFRKHPDSVTFTFARGGHPYPILCRRGSDQVEFIKSRGNLLGWQENTEFGDMTLTLYPGDRLFLYTDGIPDTVNPAGQMLDSQDDFIDMFRDPERLTLSGMLDNIIDRTMRFREEAPIVDDIIIIGIEVH